MEERFCCLKVEHMIHQRGSQQSNNNYQYRGPAKNSSENLAKIFTSEDDCLKIVALRQIDRICKFGKMKLKIEVGEISCERRSHVYRACGTQTMKSVDD